MTKIPIFRAKKIDSDGYAYGCLMMADDYDTDEDEDQRVYFIMHKMENYRTSEVWDFVCNSRVDPTTLAIHFPDMLDSQGNKIFASLSEDGKGGSLVVSKSYPFYGDAPEIHTSSGKCEELNYKGLICFSSNGCYLDYIKVSDRVRGNAIGGVIEEFNEYKVIGIQE